jgi:hypothetical protein
MTSTKGGPAELLMLFHCPASILMRDAYEHALSNQLLGEAMVERRVAVVETRWMCHGQTLTRLKF